MSSNLAPESALQKLNSANVKVIETGLKHGTLTVVIDKQQIELTTFRKPGPHGLSNFSNSIEVDLSGRDFTINAIAYSVKDKILLDPMDGIKDLNQKILKAVNDPLERFKEDPLRILRMLRFGPASGFEVENETKLAAIQTIEELSMISPERICSEFFKILLLESATSAFRYMRDTKILEYIFPELLPAVGFEQNEYHIHDVFEHTMWVIDRSPKNLIVRLAAFFHDLGKPKTLTIDEKGVRHFYKHELESELIAKSTLKRLRCSKKIINEVSTIVRLHMRPLDCGPAGLRRIIRDVGEYFENWQALKIADSPPKVPKEEMETILSNFDKMLETEKNRKVGSPFQGLEIDGEDLINLGLKPSPNFGLILKNLNDQVIEQPELNVKETLLKLAKEEIKKLDNLK